MAIKVIICLVLGYIFGCFQTGYFYGKLFKGIDVRNYGSGNAGTTNTLRTLGKPAGYIVFLGDALKAVFAVWIVRYLLFPGLGDVTKILETVTALGVVIGHNYPFYMHFKGRQRHCGNRWLYVRTGCAHRPDRCDCICGCILYNTICLRGFFDHYGTVPDSYADLLSWTVGGVWTQSDIHGTGLVAASGEY